MRLLLLAVLVLPAVLAACADPAEPRRVAQAGRGDRSPLRIALSSDRPAYAPGQPVTLTLVVENTGAAPVVITAPTGQLHDFAVLQGDREIWRWSADLAFPAQITEWTLEPGQRREFSQTWHPGPGAPPPGDHAAVGTLAGGGALGVPPARITFRVN